MAILRKPTVASKQAQPAQTQPQPSKAQSVEPPATIQDHSEEADATALAVQEPSHVVSHETASSLVPYVAGTGAASFDDLDGQIGYGSFPMVKLEAGEFVCETKTLKEFACIMKSMRKKFLFKCDKDHTAYSYDRVHRQDGTPLREVFADWVSQGLLGRGQIPAQTEYAEVAALITDGFTPGRMVILSVPPASVRRLAGYKAETRVSAGLSLNEAVTFVRVGPKVTTKNKEIFFPWDFAYAGKAADISFEEAE